MLKSATGATLIVNDIGITSRTARARASPCRARTVTVNNGALRRDVRRAMPGLVLHVGATVLCAHARSGAADVAPNPRVLVERPAGRDAGRPRTRSPAAPSARRRAAARASTAQWVRRRTRVLRRRACRLLLRTASGGLRADRARRLIAVRHAAAGRGRRDRCSVDFPFRFDGRGRTATTGDDEHVRDLIEQVLFTAPGERVNRPTFGSGLLQLVFAPNSDELAAATQLTVQARCSSGSAS